MRVMVRMMMMRMMMMVNAQTTTATFSTKKAPQGPDLSVPKVLDKEQVQWGAQPVVRIWLEQ